MVEHVVRHVEVSAASFSPVTRRALLAAVDMIEVAGLRYGARFSRLPPHAASRLIEGLSNGPSLVRRMFRSARDLVVVAYSDQHDLASLKEALELYFEVVHGPPN